MSKITITYETGRIWVCEVDAVGDGDAGEICAASSSVFLDSEGFVFEPLVMSWNSGRWRVPTGVTDEWTSSSQDYIELGSKRLDMQDGSMRSKRHADKQKYTQPRYVLRSTAQLEGATSITVDGVLAYTNEGLGLVSVVGGEAQTTEYGGMEGDFATSHHPSYSTVGSLQNQTQIGIHYEPERGIS